MCVRERGREQNASWEDCIKRYTGKETKLDDRPPKELDKCLLI